MEQHQNDQVNPLKRQYFLAAINLILERLWNVSRLLLCLAGLFVALSWGGLWGALNPYIHLVALFFLVAAALCGLYGIGRHFKMPNREEILASLERRNAFSHRPLRSANAQLTFSEAGSEISRRLWELHQDQQKKIAKKAKTGWPKLNLAEGDKYSLRSGIILLMVTGYFVGGDERNLQAAFIPDFSLSNRPIEVDVWAAPPEYTKIAPRLLSAEDRGDGKSPALVTLPTGSKLIARILGDNLDKPTLVHENKTHAFLQIDPKNYELEILIDKSGALRVENDGDLLAQWDIAVIPDLAPVVGFKSLPQVTERFAFRLHYAAKDDYGVTGLVAQIQRTGDDGEISLKLPVAPGSLDAEGKSYHDLTAHPWAGFLVELSLIGTDAINQTGITEPLSFILPERNFTHPVAKAIIEQRKKLVEDSIANKKGAIVALTTFGLLPASLNNDFTVLLSLSLARSILVYGNNDDSVDEVIEILWDTALRLENGDLSAAEIALREAERALMEALNSDVSDAEIKRLVEELKAAMDAYLQALAENSEGMEASPNSPNSEGQRIGQDELQKLLDKVDQFARSGAKDAARELLSELQEILENLKSAQSSPPSAEMQAGQKMLKQLGDLMRRQQNLLDETFRRSREGEQDPNQSDAGKNQAMKGYPDMAGRQEALRQMLGDLMGDLGMKGKIPGSLGKAERSMNGARQSLEQGEGREATEGQSNALDQLRQAAKEIADKLMEGSGGDMVGQGEQGTGRDPMGRPLPGTDGQGRSSENNFILQENALSRARIIQDELRRRLSDPARSDLEKQYLRRLMERFE
ncbi:MAG: TIGR02302 family protein [Sneathiella sp.]